MSPGPRRWRRATAASRPARSRSAARSSPIWPGRASPRWPASSAGARSPARHRDRLPHHQPAARGGLSAAPAAPRPGPLGHREQAPLRPRRRLRRGSMPRPRRCPPPGIAAQLRHHPHPPGRSLNLRSPRELPRRSRQRHHPRDRARSLNDPARIRAFFRARASACSLASRPLSAAAEAATATPPPRCLRSSQYR